MTINLHKNQSISLLKKEDKEKGLQRLQIGVGWDPVSTAPPVKKGLFGGLFSSSSSVESKTDDMDNDLSVFVFRKGKFVQKVYYGGRTSTDKAILLSEDNRTGAGDGDDETVLIDLPGVQADRLYFTVNIYNAKAKNQHFGLVKNAYIRVTNPKTGEELIRYNLTDDYKNKTSIIFAEAL